MKNIRRRFRGLITITILLPILLACSDSPTPTEVSTTHESQTAGILVECRVFEDSYFELDLAAAPQGSTPEEAATTAIEEYAGSPIDYVQLRVDSSQFEGKVFAVDQSERINAILSLVPVGQGWSVEVIELCR